MVVAPKLNQGAYQMWVTNFDTQYAVAPGTIGIEGGGGGGR